MADRTGPVLASMDVIIFELGKMGSASSSVFKGGLLILPVLGATPSL